MVSISGHSLGHELVRTHADDARSITCRASCIQGMPAVEAPAFRLGVKMFSVLSDAGGASRASRRGLSSNSQQGVLLAGGWRPSTGRHPSFQLAAWYAS